MVHVGNLSSTGVFNIMHRIHLRGTCIPGRLFEANTLFRSLKFSITVLFYHLLFVHAYGVKQCYFIYKIHFIDFNCSNVYFTKKTSKHIAVSLQLRRHLFSEKGVCWIFGLIKISLKRPIILTLSTELTTTFTLILNVSVI